MPADATPSTHRARTALLAGAALFAVYAATAATAVTFWDAGEFLAAFHTLGIPHPPGTPLFVLIGRVAVVALRPLGPVLPASLVSAACTATAGGVLAWLVHRWTGRGRWALAAALCAGATSTVWLDATEPEVYAASLCLAMLTVLVAERRGRDAAGVTLLAYLFGLAAPLHVSALVAAPAVMVLAARRDDGTMDWRALARVGGLATAAVGVGTASVVMGALGTSVVLGAAWLADRRGAARALGDLAALALGASAIVVLLARARHDPALNQGAPFTWHALADVIARRQYAVAPPWPRQAPWWLQLANVGEWADWQFALGLDAEVGARPARLPFTAAYLALGALGAARLRRVSGRAFAATLALFVAGSVGVAAYLNLKAGPSFGYGVLPAGAVREARERDYFFALAFWTWGAWAGVGAVSLFERAARAWPVGVALAALPFATNWRAVTRRREPDASLPRALADALLATVPRGGVLIAIGDNDTYPVWYAQHAEGVRRDVIPVTTPLLGAPWYRAELARRHALLPPGAEERWLGEWGTVRAIVAAAERQGRVVVVAATALPSVRDSIGGGWTLVGAGWRHVPGAAGVALDTAATARVAARVRAEWLAPARDADGVSGWAQRALGCPGGALRASLEASCNPK